MAAHPIVAAKRRQVIEARKEGTPQTEIAAREQISRKTVRRWQARHEAHGENWLMDRVPRRQPAMPNQTPLEVELAIVDYALAHPEAGPRTIAAALRAEHGVGVTAVYGTLKRRGLKTRAKRLEELRRRSGQTEPDAVERDRLLSKKRHLKAPEPGYLVGADTALVGGLKEAGIVHLVAAIDVHSSYGTAVLAPARNAEMATSAVERLRRELLEEGVTKTDRVLTDNGTEFKGRPSHPFEALCRRLGAKHRYTKVRQSLGPTARRSGSYRPSRRRWRGCCGQSTTGASPSCRRTWMSGLSGITPSGPTRGGTTSVALRCR